MTTPEGFLKAEFSPHTFRALTSEEEKLIVRHFASQEVQDIKFWTDAARNNLVQERGYTLIKEEEFKTDGGAAGRRFLFEVSMGDVPYSYSLIIFSTQGSFWLSPLKSVQHIYTAEFLCEKKNFDKHAPAVEKALRQFVPRRGNMPAT